MMPRDSGEMVVQIVRIALAFLAVIVVVEVLASMGGMQ